MTRIKIISLAFILFISCKNNTQEKELSPDKGEIENKVEDVNFPIVDFSPGESGFYENIYGTEGAGPSLILTFSIQNNTPYTITQFDFSRFARANYKDGEYEYFPRDIMDSNINDDMARFDHDQSKIDVLEEGEVWKPNEIRDFEIFIYQSGFLEQFNFSKKKFERTPEQFYFAFKYYAVSVDEEFENYQVFDILEFWKSYQEEIGLR
jgi:hypothetical protein